MTKDSKVRTILLGSTGYVGGEVLRLLAGHPKLRLGSAVSESKAGQNITAVFPHLRGSFDGVAFETAATAEALLHSEGPLALFSALPHGEAAARLDHWLKLAEKLKRRLEVVDLSADYRIADPAAYESVYGRPHGAPERLASFVCALPELLSTTPRAPIAHPGCFTTATTLACAPLQALKLVEPRFFVSAVTGSTGSGREPSAGTHHPERHGNLKAYSPLKHRHEIEMRGLIGATGGDTPEVLFVPHSGPFARGIHATVHARLLTSIPTKDLVEAVAGFYSKASFLDVSASPPNLKDVVGSNRCRLGIEVRGQDVVVFSVIDNLIKGAAGGGMQWMNRLFGWTETLGLEAPALAWA